MHRRDCRHFLTSQFITRVSARRLGERSRVRWGFTDTRIYLCGPSGSLMDRGVDAVLEVGHLLKVPAFSVAPGQTADADPFAVEALSPFDGQSMAALDDADDVIEAAVDHSGPILDQL